MKTLFLSIALALVAFPALPSPNCLPSIVALDALNRFGVGMQEQGVMPDIRGNEVHWVLWVNVGTRGWTVTASQGVVTCFIKWAPSGYSGQTLADLMVGEPT